MAFPGLRPRVVTPMCSGRPRAQQMAPRCSWVLLNLTGARWQGEGAAGRGEGAAGSWGGGVKFPAQFDTDVCRAGRAGAGCCRGAGGGRPGTPVDATDARAADARGCHPTGVGVPVPAVAARHRRVQEHRPGRSVPHCSAGAGGGVGLPQTQARGGWEMGGWEMGVLWDSDPAVPLAGARWYPVPWTPLGASPRPRGCGIRRVPGSDTGMRWEPAAPQQVLWGRSPPSHSAPAPLGGGSVPTAPAGDHESPVTWGQGAAGDLIAGGGAVTPGAASDPTFNS